MALSLLPLVVVEIGLRILGYGHDTRLIVPVAGPAAAGADDQRRRIAAQRRDPVGIVSIDRPGKTEKIQLFPPARNGADDNFGHETTCAE